jgi:hypothetical protein
MAKEAVKKEVRKDTKAPETRPMMNFAFGKKNYTYLIAGVVCLIIGFIALSGGGSKDPNVFNPELFSAQRMVFAPILLLIGYGVIAYAIMIKPKAENEEAQ